MSEFISFQPLIPWFGLLALVIGAALLVLIALFLRLRGSFLRFLSLLILSLALANPIINKEQREKIPSTIGVIIDKSPSQNIGNRTDITNKAVADLKTELAKYPQFSPRFIDAAQIDIPKGENGNETKLFAALDKATSDIASSLYAGTIILTDGQVHDSAFAAKTMANQHPINVLLTGHSNEYDRQIKFVDPPRFGIKNKPISLKILVEDKNSSPNTNAATEPDTNQEVQNTPKTATVFLSINGKEFGNYMVPIGEIVTVEITQPIAGKAIIEASTPVQNNELTNNNNHTTTIVDFVQENLRVLLVSGEPHNGERAWRDLLKSDASIDLVHFTILRPPEKADNTPINQLSLIVFPTTELFVDRLMDFDLVIFDRYQHYDVLPLIYYDYIAQYVLNGGALLMATGPEFSGKTSLANTPLIAALPALPSGEIIEKPFRPNISLMGQRHPVTRGLTDGQYQQQNWGRWLRQIAITPQINGQVLMHGVDEKPLLILSHMGQGRVAMLLSDEGWLWARGFEGGGPYAALYRRIAHWLMKQPELEEEALTASSNGQMLTINLQTMSDFNDDATILSPSNKENKLPLQKSQEGLYQNTFITDETGLFTITAGNKSTLVHVGPINTPEYTELITKKDILQPIVEKSGGHISYVQETPTDAIHIPNIAIVDSNTINSKLAKTNLILQKAEQTRLVNNRQFSLFSGLLALIASLLFLSSMWYREGH